LSLFSLLKNNYTGSIRAFNFLKKERMNTLRISRTPLFWIALTSVCVSGLIFTYHYFPKAFAILNIHIAMNRQEALEKASILSQDYQWGPEGYQAAAAFQSDDETKNFIELEGGGVKALNEIIKEKWYSPYYWRVRHFKEHDAHETEIFFMPEGTFYGFHEKLPEDAPGAALSAAQALQIARDNTFKNWAIDLSTYLLAESSQETQPNGRIDHQFIYHRINKTVNGAPFQLRIGITGDRLTEIKYEIKVPESFKRRYEHMRSANNSISFAALFLMCILYLGIGCFAGIAFLLSRHSFLWRPALIAAFFVAFLQTLNTLNELPLSWMEYETALSKTSFFLHLFTSLFAQLFLYTSLLTLIFAVAEGLTRYAFGNHLKMWSIWKHDAASSIQVLGRTIGGYLVIGFDMALITAMYAFASRVLGWWNPAETLFNPNVLATYQPWFSSLSQSILAGSMEECLFRAIPLAGAALVGARFGRRNVFIFLAFILQAIIFGAAHANYPAQPAYARLVELIIPSFVLGIIYLIYGLLPAILSHTLFDIFWFALPLFISTAAGTIFNKFLVIICSSIPLFIVLYARLKTKKFTEAPGIAYNKTLQPGPKIAADETPLAFKEHAPHFSTGEIRTLILCAVLGSLAWIGCTQFNQNNYPLAIAQSQAQDATNKMLSKRGFTIAQPQWTQLVSTQGEVTDQDRFTWQENGKDIYMKLLGSYIVPASWKIRYAQFEGDIAERSEEFGTLIDGKGAVLEYAHSLPEARPGATLSEQEARRKVLHIIKEEFEIDTTHLTEISAVSKKHPARLDWTFIFKDPSIQLKQGEARIKISLAGDQLSETERSIFIPEQWQRNEKQYQTIVSIIGMICTLLVLLALTLFVFLFIKRWRQFLFSASLFFIVALLLGLKATLQAINIWPLIVATFKTSEPYQYQALRSTGWLLLQIVAQSLYFGAGAALGSAKLSKLHAPQSLSIFIGVCCGFILSSLKSLSFILAPSIKPLWADYTHAASLIPSIGFALSFFTSYVSTTIIFLLLTRFSDLITDKWHKRTIAGLMSLILITFCLNGLSVESIGIWFVSSILGGISIAVLYYFVLRHIRSSIPIMTATLSVLSIVQQMAFHAYPGSSMGSIFATLLIVSLAVWWSDNL
jgi:membrane protease YdiL (CAAX protease family)